MAANTKKGTSATGIISEMDRYLFGQGTHYEIYEKLGAHPMTLDGKRGVYFAVWAPHAASVSLVGDFNNWEPESHPMTLLETSGIYEIFVPGLKEGNLYKFAIVTQTGKLLFKADPYARSAEFRPGTASAVASDTPYKWSDSAWLQKRRTTNPREAAMSIYEVHLGSWRKKDREEKNGFYTYREAAVELAEYVKDMGYTHVELMGIAEHPFDGSWGYQVTGYYAPTSRYGTPEDFQYFVNYLHKKGIGVILDWVPAHFPRDAHGLADFDGQALYEYADPRKGEHPDWGTKVFDYGKHEVSNFLIANALYWVDKFHVDGLRVDAVASMLYLDYGRKDGEWIANQYGGNQNLEAIEFLKHLNSMMKKRNPEVQMIAEESTAWPQVTGAVEEGSLGFDMKWNMGWMNDFLGYMSLDPLFRKGAYGQLLFSLVYTYSEKFMLVLSHDEVVHGKGSMIEKMPGEYKDKFANLRVAYGFMLCHPGKKLLFMGQDFAQFTEFNEGKSLEWFMLEYEMHKKMQDYMRELIHFYKEYPALYTMDNEPEGFEWINDISADESIIVFTRNTSKKDETLLVVCNFTPVVRKDYKIGVPFRGKFKEIFNSDAVKFGGDGNVNPRLKQSKAEECDGRDDSIKIIVPPLGISIFKCTPLTPAKKRKK